jgi:diguanylate cyclase (GGDEF)-like protein
MDEVSTVFAQPLQNRVKALEARALWLWLLNLLAAVVLTAGVVFLLYPDVFGSAVDFRPTLLQLSRGLFALLGLIFVLDLLALVQWRAIRQARGELLAELSRRDAAERRALTDPVTGTFDRRYLDEVIPRETARADRRETTLSLVKLGVERFEGVDARLGFQAGERILQETAQLLKHCFRPTDIIIRYGVAEFLVLLPETARLGAINAVGRLFTKVDEWNRRKPIPGFELELSVGVADYTRGKDVRDTLGAVETRVQLYRDRRAAEEAASG